MLVTQGAKDLAKLLRKSGGVYVRISLQHLHRFMSRHAGHLEGVQTQCEELSGCVMAEVMKSKILQHAQVRL